MAVGAEFRLALRARLGKPAVATLLAVSGFSDKGGGHVCKIVRRTPGVKNYEKIIV
jgi:hypothetical protein